MKGKANNVHGHYRRLLIPCTVSFVSIIYLLTRVPYIRNLDFCRAFIFTLLSLLLSFLPFFNSTKYKNHEVAISAIVLEVGVICLEYIYGRKQCLSSYFAFILIYRVLYNGTFYDNFALCLAFSSNVGSITRQKLEWYYDVNLMMWTYFVIALCLQNTYKRNAVRIWQHLRLIILLKEKLNFEKLRGKRLLAAHYPKDILDAVQQAGKKNGDEPDGTKQKLLVSNHNDTEEFSSNKSDFAQFSPPLSVCKEYEKLIDAALEKNIVQKFEQGEVSADNLSKLDHSDRRNTVIIAIKLFSHASDTLYGNHASDVSQKEESVLEHRMKDILYIIINQIGMSYKVTPIRRFGGTWIGCIGFFQSLGSELQNCIAAVEFCSHILQLTTHDFNVPITFALEHGSMIGGFARSPHFEIFGQEVRLVLQMTDFHCDKKVLIGENARLIFSQAMHHDQNIDIKIIRSAISPPWITRTLVHCFTVNNPQAFYRPNASTKEDPKLMALFSLLKQYQDVDIMSLLENQGKNSVSDSLSYQHRAYEFDFDLLQPRPNYEELVEKWNAGQTEQQISSRTRKLKDDQVDSKNGGSLPSYTDSLTTFFSSFVQNYSNLTTSIVNSLSLQSAHKKSPKYSALHSEEYSAVGTSSEEHDKSVLNLDPDNWKEGLGIEFKTTLRERYSMDVQDLNDFMFEQGKECTEEDFNDMHEEMETALFSIITLTFIKSGIRYLFSVSPSETEDMDGEIQSKLMRKNCKESKADIKRRNDSLYNILMPLFAFSNIKGKYRELEGAEKEGFSWAYGTSWLSKLLRIRSVGDKVAVIPDLDMANSNKMDADIERSRTASVSVGANSYHKSGSAPSLPFRGKSRTISNQNLFTVDEMKESDDEQGSNKTSSDQAVIGTDRYYRNWEKYLVDARTVVHHDLISFLINVFFAMVAWIAIRDYIFRTNRNHNPATIGFVKIFLLHMLLQLSLEQYLYGPLGSIIMILIRAFIIIFLPTAILNNRLFYDNSDNHSYGDMGGDVALLLFLTFRIPSHLRESALLPLLDGLICRIILGIRKLAKRLPVDFTVHGSAALALIALDVAYLVIYYQCYVSYHIEHNLIPYALDQYRQQLVNTRKLLHLLAPEAANKFSNDIFRPHSYRSMSLAAVHVKPSDKLAGFLSAEDFCNVMYSVGEVIDESMAESGLLKVGNFAGVFIAVVAKDADWDRLTGLRVPSNHTARTIMFLRVLKLKLDKFCKHNNIHITVSIGIDEGSGYMGFIGGDQFSFDIDSEMRYKAVCMASYNNDAFFVSSRVEEELEKVFPAEDLLHVQKCADQWGEEFWFTIASTFHGVQLNDFTYTGMLGKGGYGAVHLLCEKYTNKQYAIKAINLKENSVLSNMMQRECIILQRMNHPNVINLKYAFMANNRLYLVMSYISCGNLKQVIDRDNPPLEVLRLWFAELIQAIQYIHSIGIIHRDIKPANCMIDNKGHLKLGDFGLSKIIRSSTGNDLGNGDEFASEAGGNGYRLQAPSMDFSSKSNRSTPLGVKTETYMQLQKYLPLKAYLVTDHSNHENTVTVPILHIIFSPTVSATDSKDKSSEASADYNMKTFSNSLFKLEVTTLYNGYHAVSLLKSKNIEAIFIDIQANQPSTSKQVDELVDHIQNKVRSRIPIYLTHVTNIDDSLRYMKQGVKECFEMGVNDINVAVYKRLFAIHHDDYHHMSSTSSSQSISSEETSSRRGSSSADESRGQVIPIQPPTALENSDHSMLLKSMDEPQPTLCNRSAQPPSNSNPIANSQTNQTGDYNLPLSLTNVTSPHHHQSTQPAYSTAKDQAVPEDAEHTIVGTIHYIAPEVINDRKYGESVDWWALGITVYVCIVKKHVFHAETPAEIRELISKGVVDVNPLMEFDVEAHDLVKRLLVKVEERLAFATEIIHHPFFSEMRWHELSDMEMLHKPAEFKVGKYDLKEKLNFYGEPDARERFNLSIKKMEERSSMSMNKFLQNVQRTRKKKRYGKHAKELIPHGIARIASKNMEGLRKERVSGESLSGQYEGRRKDGPHSSRSGQRMLDGNLGASDPLLEADEEEGEDEE